MIGVSSRRTAALQRSLLVRSDFLEKSNGSYQLLSQFARIFCSLLSPALAGTGTILLMIGQQVSHIVVFKALLPQVTPRGVILMVTSLLPGAGEIPPSAEMMLRCFCGGCVGDFGLRKVVVFSKCTHSELWRMERSLSFGVPPAGAQRPWLWRCAAPALSIVQHLSRHSLKRKGNAQGGWAQVTHFSDSSSVSDLVTEQTAVQLSVEMEVIERHRFFPLMHEWIPNVLEFCSGEASRTPITHWNTFFFFPR